MKIFQIKFNRCEKEISYINDFPVDVDYNHYDFYFLGFRLFSFKLKPNR